MVASFIPLVKALRFPKVIASAATSPIENLTSKAKPLAEPSARKPWPENSHPRSRLGEHHVFSDLCWRNGISISRFK